MSALGVAREHCANWDKGACSGFQLGGKRNEIRITSCKPLPKCLLADPIQKCLYFESCVMPTRIDPSLKAVKRAFDEGVYQYRVAIKKDKHTK